MPWLSRHSEKQRGWNLYSVPLDALLDYGRCPLLYWWRWQARIKAPPTVEALPERAIRQGLARYYEGRAMSVLEGSITTWKEWVTDWKCPPETIDWLQQYADIDIRLLAPFLDGSIRRDNGTLYQAPRMTRHYKEQARAAGLTKLKRQLQQATRDAPIVAAGEADLVQAFSDTVLMALRYDGPQRDPYGNVRSHYPFEIPITAGLVVRGAADLVILEQEKVTIAEFFDFGPYRVPVPALSRHLVVIALLHAEGEGWEDKRSVVYRHMPTGSFSWVTDTESRDRLLPVIAAALRGVQCGVYLPRLAVTETNCLRCPYYGLCVTEDGLDVLDDLDATLVALGDNNLGGGRKQTGDRIPERGRTDTMGNDPIDRSMR